MTTPKEKEENEEKSDDGEGAEDDDKEKKSKTKKTTDIPKEALVKVHEVIWIDSKDCNGNIKRVKMLKIPNKKDKEAGILKNKLRRLTNLNIF